MADLRLHAWFMGKDNHWKELIEGREGEYEWQHGHAHWSTSKCPRDEIGQRCLCKRQHNLLTLFFLESGVVHYVPLPFSVKVSLCNTSLFSVDKRVAQFKHLVTSPKLLVVYCKCPEPFHTVISGTPHCPTHYWTTPRTGHDGRVW